MPALPAVPGVLRVRILWDMLGKEAQGSRFFVAFTGGPSTVANLTALGGLYNAAAASDLVNLMSNDVAYKGVIIEDLTTSSSAVAEVDTTVTGTRGSAAVPPQSCVVTSFEIARRYRGGRPRLYWPFGVAGDMLNTGLWDSTLVSATTTGVTAFFNAGLGVTEGSITTDTNVNVSYYEGFTVVTNPITGRSRNVPKLRATPDVDAYGTFVTRNYVGSQRRRRLKTSTS